ncbi:ubiquitin-like-specific protease 1D isoform X1 [Amborella trichopoda]|uniref:Ubiquitin-like protease family profile domain-containing protein n=1 Tax=Amborella trichopoda TaxID=13333 RepID=W1PG63_AMBTC|nr:ubiquitin-like-specific protease 1D isoform X1 [Amborella trichopoda]XP_020523153.1 ubiquitin-like-specific protease 1D isoform X1 [Amborella trichopoda]ERN06626.1 hypothetical protein AMTR_s00058p00168420 [Amborella trichopoda]|eukprot:XP_006844951.1 ubiquitin-like-specific protease 1D isoform X1 [Amborella trichopoda]
MTSLNLVDSMENQPLKLDWNKLLPGRDDPVAELEVLSDSRGKIRDETVTELDSLSMSREKVEKITDHQLEEKIQRVKRTLSTSFTLKLPDGGEKFRTSLKRLEDEKERRKIQRLKKEADESEKSKRNSIFLDAFLDHRSQPSTSLSQSMSSSGLIYQKVETKPDGSINDKGNAFEKELGFLGPKDPNSLRSQRLRKPKELWRTVSSKQSPFGSPFSFSIDEDKRKCHVGDRKGITSSRSSPFGMEKNCPSHGFEKRSFSTPATRDLTKRKVQTVVLLDEEDLEPTQDLEKEPHKGMTEAKIYYPSRDHPDAVEICYSDMECLAPRSYLSSPIMNFYIQYLQRPELGFQGDYHFFSTYFYKKLEEAVSHKRRTDKRISFAKLRRWWKGVNIFQKAYIFLPVHADQHWSLVIICIPSKEDESGPFILHLDSMGLHFSMEIFDNIKSFLVEEWNYLKQRDTPPDIPIIDKIWKQLPGNIQQRRIEVPQQKNEYDCGLFVLYFIERFIEDAPERVRKKDLAMFGRKWFRPEEASDLRLRIRKLLYEEFEAQHSDEKELSPSPMDDSV